MPDKRHQPKIGEIYDQKDVSEEMDLDYERLESMRTEILQELLENPDLTKEEKDFLVARVFEHSVNDGIEFADKLNIDPDKVAEFLSSESFALKHTSFSQRLTNRIDEYSNFTENGTELKRIVNYISRARANRIKSRKKHSNSIVSDQIIGETAQNLKQKIDKYYGNFIRHRQVREAGSPIDTRSSGEKIGERALGQAMIGLDHYYYRNTIIELIGGENANKHPELFEPIVSEKDVRKILGKYGISLDKPDVEKKLSKARYLPWSVVYNTLQSEAERRLRAEIKDSIMGRGYKDEDFDLVYDEENRKYRIINKRPEEIEFKKENLSLVEEFPDDFVMTPDHPYYESFDSYYKEHIKNYSKYSNRDLLRDNQSGNFIFKRPHRFIIDGEIYTVTDSDTYLDFITYPDGRLSNQAHAFQNFKKTKRGLVYVVNDSRITDDIKPDNNNFQVYIDSKRVSEDNKWERSGYVLGNDGTIYLEAYSRVDGFSSSRRAVFKESEQIFTSDFDDSIDLPCVIENEPVILVRKRGEGQYHKFYYKGNEFGPYEDVIFPRQGDELKRLVFIYKAKNGSYVLFNNGRETNLENNNKASFNMVVLEDKLYVAVTEIIESRASPEKDVTISYFLDENGNKIGDEYVQIRELHAVNDGLLFVSHNKDGSQELHYKDKIIYSDKIDGVGIDYLGNINGEIYFRINMKIYSEDGDCINLEEMGIRSVSDCVIYNDVLHIICIDTKGNSLHYNFSPRLKPTEKEQKKLDLINSVKAESLKQIEKYFKKHYPEEDSKSLLEKVRERVSKSKEFVLAVNSMIGKLPSLFLDSLGAKRDDLTETNIENILEQIIPDTMKRFRLKKRFAEGMNSWNRNDRAGANEYLRSGRSSSEIRDADPKDSHQPIEILTFREPMNSFVVTGIYGKYKSSNWSQLGFQLSQKQFGPTREVTAEIKIVSGMRNIVLPKTIDGVIIPERVKGIDGEGKEISLEVNIDSQGIATISVPDNIKTILYSQSVQETPSIPEDISQKLYDDFKKQYERRYGEEISTSIAKLPDEMMVFIKSIDGMTPVEKLIEIEKFVKNIGYYDFDNRVVQEKKKGKVLNDIFAVMRNRMSQIKREKRDKAKDLDHKKYAGVCTDFAKLTTALLREAGFVSGIVDGFNPSPREKTITTKNAHAISFALFPDEGSKSMCVTIDATPVGMTADEQSFIDGIRQKSLADRIKLFKQGKEKSNLDADDLLDDLEDILQNLDPDKIRRLKNGQLEKVLNTVLRQVTNSHLSVIENILNTSRYTGFDISRIIKDNDLEAKIDLIKLMESGIQNERGKVRDVSPFKGGELLNLIEEFILRYSKDRGVSGRKEALSIIEKTFGLIGDKLDPIESRSVTAILTYLKAESISGR